MTIQGKRILCIEDDPAQRLVLRKLLQHVHARVEESPSAEHALRMLESESAPDLVLTDVVMPGMNGTSFLAEVRKRFNAIELPVIITTGRSDSAHVVEALRMGANDYIVKPLCFEVTLSRITTHLRLAEVSRDMARLKELQAIHSMVITYNHEINNPLAAAIMAIGQIERTAKGPVPSEIALIKGQLWRIAGIVQRIADVGRSDVQYERYPGEGNQMVKLAK
jgi:DNA-binding response OmpR family regulator